MLAPPLPHTPKRPNAGHVGLGWDVVHQFAEGYRYGKAGGKPGIQAWLEHMENGVDWAFLYNTSAPKGRNSRAETVKRMHETFQTIVGKAL
jgi:hypothetical protein